MSDENWIKGRGYCLSAALLGRRPVWVKAGSRAGQENRPERNLVPGHPAQPLQVAAQQPVAADFVLLAEKHDVASVDPLVHQLGNVGRRQVPFLGDCPDTAPQCIAGMCAVSLETLTRLPLIKLRYG